MLTVQELARLIDANPNAQAWVDGRIAGPGHSPYYVVTLSGRSVVSDTHRERASAVAKYVNNLLRRERERQQETFEIFNGKMLPTRGD
jgi:hypothetical protein